MLQKILIFLVAATVLAADASKRAPDEVTNARKAIRQCFNEALFGDGENRICKNGDDLKGLAEEYIEVEKIKNNMTVSLNPKYSDLVQFVLSHPHVKDFLKNYTCINTTSCLNKERGIDASSIKNSNTNVGKNRPKKLNIVSLFFTKTSEPKYDLWHCDNSESLKKCLVEESKRHCSNNTMKFLVDVFDRSLTNCKSNIQPTPMGGRASQLIPASFLITLILAVKFV